MMKKPLRYRYRILSLTVILSVAGLAPVVGAENLTALLKPSSIKVTYDPAKDLLSVHAHQAPLAKVLFEISHKAQVTIDTANTELLKEQISAEIKRVSLEQALKQLLVGFNWAFLHSSPGDAHPKETVTRLVKVILISKKADITVRALKEERSEKERQETLHSSREVLQPIAALKGLAPQEAVNVLGSRLQAGDQQIRVTAAAALGTLGDERGVEALSSALTGDDPVTRQAAASGLARIGGERASPILLHAYQAGDNGVKNAVAVAIASHGDQTSQKALAKVMAETHAPGEMTGEQAGGVRNIEKQDPE